MRYKMFSEFIFDDIDLTMKTIEIGGNVKMDKEEMLQQIEDLKQQINKLESELHKEDNKKVWWTPEECEEYWIVNTNGEVCCIQNDESEFDHERIDNLNVYKTKQQAERQAFEELLRRELKKFAFENNEEEIDWNDLNQTRYCVKYDYEDKELIVDSIYYYGSMDVYFTSLNIANKAIETFKDDLIRLFTRED